jgi:hypothetical protein
MQRKVIELEGVEAGRHGGVAMTSRTVSFTIYGEMASKANSRRLVINPATAKLISIKSAKSMNYWHAATVQLPKIVPFTEPVSVTIHAYYASQRPDLDPSVLLDVMQSRYTGSGKARKLCLGAIYENDRLVREQHFIHHIDAKNPRAEVTVQTIDNWGMGQAGLRQPADAERERNKRMRARMDAL